MDRFVDEQLARRTGAEGRFEAGGTPTGVTVSDIPESEDSWHWLRVATAGDVTLGEHDVQFHARETAVGGKVSDPKTAYVDVLGANVNTAPTCEAWDGWAEEYAVEVETDEEYELGYDIVYCEDAEGDDLDEPAIGDPDHGTIVKTLDDEGFGYYTFDPDDFDPGADGTLTQTDITVTDHPQNAAATAMQSAPASMFFKITRPDHNPTCADKTVTVAKNAGPTEIILTCEDLDTADDVFVGVGWGDSQVTHGSIEIPAQTHVSGQKKIVYTPSADGTDVAFFYADDGDDFSADATLTIKVGSGTGGGGAGGGGTGGGSTTSTTTTTTTTTTPVITAEQVKALLTQVLQTEVAPDVVNALTKALNKALAAGASSVTAVVGPFSTDVTITVAMVFGASGNSASASKPTTVGSGKLALAKGAKGKLKLTLNKKGKALLKKKGKLKVTLRTTIAGPSGSSATTSKVVTIKAKKAKKKKR